MIKFFKHIRKTLIEKNQMGKYFKYAIGEILLVVIGILIALSINNWNENRINNIKLKSYLTEIVSDFKRDTIAIRGELNEAKKRIEKTKSFLAIKDYNALTIDSLEKSLETFYFSIPFSHSAFEKIESSGITNYGKYEGLIEAYKFYYTFIVPDFKEAVEGGRNRAVDLEDNYWRYSQNAYEFTYDDELNSYQNKEAAKENLVRLLQSPTARNILKVGYHRNKNLIIRLNGLNNYLMLMIDDTKKTLND